tara:strand:+ start:1967 stop:2566 length:600 start_codon:yes stop_codon:yes gene_type:complete
MPTVNLFPSSTFLNNWPTVAGSSAHAALASSSSSSYIRTPDQNDFCTVELDNFTAGGTINSIQVKMLGYVFATRSASFDVQIRLSDNATTMYYSEDVTIAFNGYVPTAANGTVRTTSDGSTAWTTTQLNNLRLDINTQPTDPPSFSQATITYAYVEVDYTAAPSSATVHTINTVAEANIATIKGVAHANIAEINTVTFD